MSKKDMGKKHEKVEPLKKMKVEYGAKKAVKKFAGRKGGKK